MYIENVNAIDVKKGDLEKLAQYQRTLWSKPQLTYLFLELTDSCNLCSCLGLECLVDTNDGWLKTNNSLRYVKFPFSPCQILGY